MDSELRSEWMGIDSAPKDHTRFLAYEPPGAFYVCKWAFSYKPDGNKGLERIYGWIECSSQPAVLALPTHWMPLPTPPKDAKP